jgi:hypothetical protein
MKCVICGRTEADFEKKIDAGFIRQIDEVLEILYNKRKELKEKVKDNHDGNHEDKNRTGTELGKINKEIKILNEQKQQETSENDNFFDIEFSTELLKDGLPENDCGEIIKKYTGTDIKRFKNKNMENTEMKICVLCYSILNKIVDDKIDELADDIVERVKDELEEETEYDV